MTESKQLASCDTLPRHMKYMKAKVVPRDSMIFQGIEVLPGSPNCPSCLFFGNGCNICLTLVLQILFNLFRRIKPSVWSSQHTQTRPSWSQICTGQSLWWNLSWPSSIRGSSLPWNSPLSTQDSKTEAKAASGSSAFLVLTSCNRPVCYLYSLLQLTAVESNRRCYKPLYVNTIPTCHGTISNNPSL